MLTHCDIDIRFFRPRSTLGKIICLLTKGQYAHCVVVVNGCLWNTDIRSGGGWYIPNPENTEGDTLSLTMELDTFQLDRVLQRGSRYPVWKSLTSYLIGWPDYPLNCVGSTQRVLRLGGHITKARTPHGLWKELRNLPRVVSSTD
jgi:hypothetical protein